MINSAMLSSSSPDCAGARTHTSCCSRWSPAGLSPCHCQRRSCGNSAGMHPWTRGRWIHCRLNRCCWHRYHQPGCGPDKAGAVGPQGMGLLQDKKVLRAWGLLPHQPLLGGHSCLGHAVENRTEKVKRPPRVHNGASEAWIREGALSLRAG